MDQENSRAASAPQERISTLESGMSSLEGFGRIIFFVVLIQALLMIGLNFYEKSRVNSLQEKIASTNSELSSTDYHDLNRQIEEVLSGSKRLQTVLASKVSWDKFYTMLNAVTPKDVRVTGLSIASNGSVKIDGETTSLTSLARVIVAWKSGSTGAATPFSQVVLSSNGFVDKGSGRRVVFSVTGQVNTGALK